MAEFFVIADSVGIRNIKVLSRCKTLKNAIECKKLWEKEFPSASVKILKEI